MKAIPLIVNRILNKAGFRDQVGGVQAMHGTRVIAYGPFTEERKARDMLTAAETALKEAGYAVEWHNHEGVNNSYLMVTEAN